MCIEREREREREGEGEKGGHGQDDRGEPPHVAGHRGPTYYVMLCSLSLSIYIYIYRYIAIHLLLCIYI